MRSSLKSSGKGGFALLFKLLISQFQVLGLVSSFELQWPLQVTQLLNYSNRLAASPQTILSFDCFLQNSIPPPFKRFYIYLLLGWSLPLFAILAGSTCLLCKSWKAKAFPSILICLYLLQPWVARSMLEVFDCLWIGKERFLSHELTERCWEGKHLLFSIVLGGTGLLLWGLGIPLIWKFFLRRYPKSPRLRFLTVGYSVPHWEVMIALRKLTIGIIAALMASRGSLLQALLLSLILGIFVAQTLRARPYLDPSHNHFELLSLCALLFTAYAGIFFLSHRRASSSDFLEGRDLELSAFDRWVLFIGLFLSNALFFLCWTRAFFKHLKATCKSRLSHCFKCFWRESA